jgi:hypothetical protein
LNAINGDGSQFKDFCIEAILEGVQSPKPIQVHFHNAPEVKATDDAVVKRSDTNIIAFDTTNSLSKYDTIYIPNDITTIADDIFYDKFTTIDSTCETIDNVIFADRVGTCDVGINAFSSSTRLWLKGDIYIGVGTYVQSGTNPLLFSCSYSSSPPSPPSSDPFVLMGNVTINGNLSGGSIFSSHSTSNDAKSSVQIGNVIINGNCNSNGPFFSAHAFSDATHSSGSSATSYIYMGDVTINGECINNGGCFFFCIS